MAKALRHMHAEEFARRLKAAAGEEDKRFAFFIGAGCSVSSGIPAAGSLVSDDWLPKLRDLRAPDRRDLDAWAKEELGRYSPKNPAASYGAAIEKLFLEPEDRQREIERLCDARFPGFGYAVLANLMAQEGGCFNVTLTTNFDDLVPDALYLYSPARPLVIQHESLASFIRPTRTRPLVVKLHGDQRLTPQNTATEVEQLKRQLETRVKGLLHDRAIIFLGYGGNDKGITSMLEGLPDEALPHGVFWVSGSEPKGAIRPWLEERNATWVGMQDFDEMMLLVRDVFDLAHPDDKRFARVFENYTDTYKELSGRITALPDTAPDAAALKDAVKSTDEALPGEYSLYFTAQRLEDSDPDGAEAAYAKAVEAHPGSALLLGGFARFLHSKERDYDRAAELYKRALEVRPDDAVILGRYALFLHAVRAEYKQAEESYQRALEIDPNNYANVGNYANLLHVRQRDGEAEIFYKRSLKISPDDASILGNYAFFCDHVGRDPEQTEAVYRRAILLKPNDANNVGNFAGFLLAHERDEGKSMLDAALQLREASEPTDIAAEIWFYAFAHWPDERRGEALTKLKELLLTGARSRFGRLGANLARAREDRHPEIEWLEKLAAVITEDAELSTLDGWEAWAQA